MALAPGQGAGTLKVTSTPAGGMIFLDGLSTGKQTPFALPKVPAGLEHMILVDKKGYLPGVSRLRLEDGKTEEVNLLLKKGKALPGRVKVSVRTDPPGAVVVLEGKPTKLVTPAEIGLPAGKAVKLELRLPGHAKWLRTVRVVPDVPLAFSIKLKKK